jgi:hypothetical protein
MERAATLYRKRGETRPLQVELVRFLQERVDIAYEQAVHEYNAGRLKPIPSRQVAIGNSIDRAVRRNVQELFNQYGIATTRDGPIRIQGREYNTSSTPSSYTQPDFRIDRILFDVSLQPKSYKYPQIRGFISADVKPDLTVIIRPSQLGSDSVYAIVPLEK